MSTTLKNGLDAFNLTFKNLQSENIDNSIFDGSKIDHLIIENSKNFIDFTDLGEYLPTGTKIRFITENIFSNLLSLEKNRFSKVKRFIIY